MSIRKRITALLMAVAMLFQLMPTTVLAESGQSSGGYPVVSNVLSGDTYYTVKFMNEGSVLATQFVLEGRPLIMPEAPTKDGCRFLGWYMGNTEVTESTLISADMTLTAVYEEILKYTFTVNYVDAAGNVVSSPVERSYSTDDALPVNDQGVKYVTIDSPTQVVQADQTLYPDQLRVTFLLAGDDLHHMVDVVFRPSDVSYTVRHMAMAKVEGADGSVSFTETGATDIRTPDQLTGAQGASVIPQRDTSLTGYIFEHTQELYLTENPANNVAYVYYRPAEFVLTYNTQGGSYVPPQARYYGEMGTVYTVSQSGEYICGYEAHTHVENCYNRWGRLNCGQTAHVHVDQCYGMVYDPAPVRQGYTFTGWYMDAACTIPADAVQYVSGNLTVYAGWEAAIVSYTVLYRNQVYNNSTGEREFVYNSSRTLTGYAGSSTQASALRNAPVGHSASVSIPTLTIAADGSTIVTIDYELQPYTFTFDLNDSNNATGTLYVGGQSYGSNAYSFTAYLGQNVSAKWPSPADATRSNGDKMRWWVHPSNAQYLTNRFEVTEDMISSARNGAITMTASWTTNMVTNVVQYWLQQPDGAYAISDTYSQVLIQNRNDGLNAKELYGYDNRSSAPSGDYPQSGETKYDSFTFQGKTYTSTVIGNETYKVRVHNFYYDLEKHQIDYYFSGTLVNTRNDIYFGQNINTSPYTDALSPAAAGLSDQYVFAGWYDNIDGWAIPTTSPPCRAITWCSTPSSRPRITTLSCSPARAP